jgi:hypothetical protein
MQKLRTNPLMPGKVKEGAVAALNEMVKADTALLSGRALRTITRGLGRALARAADDIALVHREAASSLGQLKVQHRELRDLTTSQTTTMFSVIKPTELDPALKRLDQGIRAANEGLPALDVRAMIDAGHIRVADQIEQHVESLVETFEDYYESHLTDVGGTVKALKLDFSVADWVGETLRNLACCSPVRMSAAGNAEPQTVIVAGGQDMEIVQQVLRRDPSLARIEPIVGTDSHSIMLHRRIEGLTIEAIPTFPDSRRAASQFPRPGIGLPAWQNLASTGHLLGAYDQHGLIPEKWEKTTSTMGHSRLVDPIGSMDGQVVVTGNRSDLES